MVKTAERDIQKPAEPGRKDLEFEIGHDSVMTVRILYGARANVTPEVLPEPQVALGRH
jgi:hypothetical protein